MTNVNVQRADIGYISAFSPAVLIDLILLICYNNYKNQPMTETVMMTVSLVLLYRFITAKEREG